MATTDRPTASPLTRPTTDAVEHYRERGVILPGSQGEIAAYLARGDGQ